MNILTQKAIAAVISVVAAIAAGSGAMEIFARMNASDPWTAVINGYPKLSGMVTVGLGSAFYLVIFVAMASVCGYWTYMHVEPCVYYESRNDSRLKEILGLFGAMIAIAGTMTFPIHNPPVFEMTAGLGTFVFGGAFVFGSIFNRSHHSASC